MEGVLLLVVILEAIVILERPTIICRANFEARVTEARPTSNGIDLLLVILPVISLTTLLGVNRRVV